MPSLSYLSLHQYQPQAPDLKVCPSTRERLYNALSDRFEKRKPIPLKFGFHTITEKIASSAFLENSQYPTLRQGKLGTNITLPRTSPPPVRRWLNGPIEVFKNKPNLSSLNSSNLSQFIRKQKLWDKQILRILYNFAYFINVDPLTGLWNRSFFDNELKQRVKAAKRPSGKPVSLAFLDLNDFKVINEVFGHSTGDSAIQSFGQILQSITLPDKSYICRTGGDEFAIIFSNGTSTEQARDVFHQIQTRLGKKYIRHRSADGKEHRIYLSCSYGFSNHLSPTNDREVYIKGDEELLQAKTLKINEKYEHHFTALRNALDNFLRDDDQGGRDAARNRIINELNKPRPSLRTCRQR